MANGDDEFPRSSVLLRNKMLDASVATEDSPWVSIAGYTREATVHVKGTSWTGTWSLRGSNFAGETGDGIELANGDGDYIVQISQCPAFLKMKHTRTAGTLNARFSGSRAR